VLKKVLVTGARGQLGSDFCKLLEKHSYLVTPTDVGELDITSLAAVKEAVCGAGFFAVINCAAYNEVDRAESEEQAALCLNALGPRNLALACEEAGVALMHFSTDFVFDGNKGAPYTIADRPAPLSAYGRSKLLGEDFCRQFCRRLYLVRLSWVFGVAGKVNFPRKVLSWASARPIIRVVDDQISRPAYTADLVPVLMKLLESGAFGLYHLANEGVCSRYQWAGHVVASAGLKTEVQPARTGDFSEAARRPPYSALDLYPLNEMFGSLPPWQEATDRFLVEIGVRS